MPTYEAVLRDAKTLSCDERALLAFELVASFDDPEEREPGYEEAWSREIHRRLDDINAGRSTLIDEEEFERLAWSDELPESDAGQG